jgi:hypothetical protein
MNNDNIVVSVLCATYNQKNYIKETLDGFLMQETDFNFEILINDDASTDGTTDILREYEQESNGRIVVNYQNENQYQKGVRGMMTKYLLPRAKGEYIALCEGDDYWTDPHKLQRQVDYMRANPECSICFHPVTVHYENSEKSDEVYPENHDNFTLELLLETNYMQTNSVLYKNLRNYEHLAENVIPNDWYMFIYHALKGDIGFIDEVMGVYRRNPSGVWSSNGDEAAFWQKNFASHIYLYEKVKDLLEGTDELLQIWCETGRAFMTIVSELNERDFQTIFRGSDTPDAYLFDYSLDVFGYFHKELIKVHEAFAREVADLRGGISASNEALSSIQEQYKDLEGHYKGLEEQYRDLEAHYKGLIDTHNATINSASHKIGSLITWPLRALMRVFRKVLGG